MWCITRNGFVSLVQDRDDPDFIRARARRAEHLLDTFETLMESDIIDLGENAPDYRFHVSLPRTHVAEAMYYAVNDIDYTSHVKEAVAGDDEVFYTALLGCWRALYQLQDPPQFDADTPTLDDLDDIVGQVGKLADKMSHPPEYNYRHRPRRRPDMILGPDDPRAITDPDELKKARAYTERFNRDVLGLKPMTAKQKADKAKLEAAILDAIGWEDPA